MKEYDLSNELGPQNWLDVLAGEAVMLGHMINDPLLVAKGTHLAQQIRCIRYDDDDFFWVVAEGKWLVKELETVKMSRGRTVFIDELYLGKEKKKSLYDWEFDLIYADKQYWIRMTLPVYASQDDLNCKEKLAGEKAVSECFPDSSFQSYQTDVQKTVYDSQTLTYTSYFDEKGKRLKRVCDFNHEGQYWYRGRVEDYFFDDFYAAWSAWTKMKEAISSQKR